MLDFTHNGWLVAASFAVALFAGFSGLSLLRGASALPVARRKLHVAVASVVLGGGIWSMHFVAMLGLQLPILFYYDALVTMMSALIAILIVGLALLVLHFGQRNAVTLTLAGCVMGAGIVGMHYVGMLGMQLCAPVFALPGMAFTLVIAMGLSTLAVWSAYRVRTRAHLMVGTLAFAAAVVAVHFVAMSSTSFFEATGGATAGPALSNAALAMIVTLSSFVLSGFFLLSGVSFFVPHGRDAAPAGGALGLEDGKDLRGLGAGEARAGGDASRRSARAGADPSGRVLGASPASADRGEETAERGGAITGTRPPAPPLAGTEVLGVPGAGLAGTGADARALAQGEGVSPRRVQDASGLDGLAADALGQAGLERAGSERAGSGLVGSHRAGVARAALAGPDLGEDVSGEAAPGPDLSEPPLAAPLYPEMRTVPFERDGRTQFADASEIAAIRAEGHYTVLYAGTEKLFCPWSISEAGARLAARGFLKAHRSYLINPSFVREFERRKDTGICYFRDTDALVKVPVSRSRLADVRRALGV